MLTRAFTKTITRRSPKYDYNFSKSGSILEISEDCIIGFMDDLPLVSCGDSDQLHLRLREVLRASVGVMGESRLGMTEKVVLWEKKVYAVKRFRNVLVGRSEFGRRVERLAQVSNRCEYLVPVTAYLYAKRIKFVVCDYYPMGSLSDLLAGGRKFGHTALDWNQRLMISLHIARAIAFIHTECPAYGKNMQMNVHGNIKASNVMINIDFTARLSDYGFRQLAEVEDLSDAWQQKPPPSPESTTSYCNKLCQMSDIYNFGVILLDMLGGARAPNVRKCIIERKEEIREGFAEFFEFMVEGKHRKQAMQVLDVALACTNKVALARPSIEQIVKFLEML